MKTFVLILSFTILLQGCISTRQPKARRDKDLLVKSKSRSWREFIAFSTLAVGFTYFSLMLVKQKED